jgi:signal transduction histidine kinase
VPKPSGLTTAASSSERETPQRAIERIITTVLGEVFQSHDIPVEVRQRAQEFANKFKYSDATYLGPEARRAGGQEYDVWIDEIFQATQTGEWREDLLRHFLGKLGLLMEQRKTDALFALVIEEIATKRGLVRYRLAEHLGAPIHAQHWRNYAAKLEDGEERAFFRELLDAQPDQADIGVWHGSSLRIAYPYSGELDELVRVATATSRRSQAEEIQDAFWLSAIGLKSEEADQPNRLVFIVYPNHGTAASPRVGRAAAHEWRMLQLLRIAYRQLDHEIRNLDRRIAAQRGDMIRDLGPGFLAHELHTHLANLHDLQVMMINNIKPLLKCYPEDPAVNAAGARLLQSVEETTRVFEVVHGYNNIMRERRIERFILKEVIEEATALTRIRAREYAKASVKVERARARAVPIETDHGLLLVVLVNILVNATQAIHEARPPLGSFPAPEGGDHIQILVESEPADAQVVLFIANSGPMISPELHERIFKRGYTTRSQGHGQGLYLCRQILESLGGNITYADPMERGLFPGTAFRIEFARERNVYQNEAKTLP